MCSDHFSPWTTRQGHSGYTWAWLGAALATTSLAFGCVSAPGQRYHPAVVAQKIATLGVMFPGRFWVALGSGEASNEHITGDGLAGQGDPDPPARGVRRGHPRAAGRRGGQPRRARHASTGRRLWERADPTPAARRPGGLGRERRAGSPPGPTGWSPSTSRAERLRDGHRRLPRRRAVAARLALQVHLSWAPTEEEALAHRPRPVGRQRLRAAGALGHRHGRGVRRAGRPGPAGRRTRRRCGSPPTSAEHRGWLAEYAELGFDDIYLHHVGQDQAGVHRRLRRARPARRCEQGAGR